MYRNLFIAWYCLGVLALTCTSFLILMPFIGADRAVGSLGFLGLLGFLPIFTATRFSFFQKEKYDERDISFLQRALFSGFCLGFSAMFAMTGTLAFACQFLLGRDSVPIEFMWFLSFSGLDIGIFSFSVTLLQLYYKGENIEIQHIIQDSHFHTKGENHVS